MFFSGVHRESIAGAAIFLCSRFVVAGGTCAFRFAGYPNLTELPTWTLPAAEPLGAEVSTYSSGNGLVYLANNGTEEPVDCIGDSWRYQLASGEWRTDVNFPDEDSTSATFDGLLFNATAGGIFTVSGIPASIAPAVSDSLYGRTIQLDLACNQEDAVDDADACVLFEVNFTNYSPEVDANMALYRFEDPAVPGFELPLAQPVSPGDSRLNDGNPIVELDGSVVDNGCNGDVAEYLGEDGEWYFWITGSDGQMFNLTHVFYATATDAVNIATIQEVWSPNLEAALYNRVVRLLIHCNNEVAFEEGYLLFYVGDAEFAQSCTEFPELCASYGVDSSDGVAAVGHGGGAAAGLATILGRLLVAAGAVSASAVYRRWW